MIFKIADGRECFYQWDIDRQLIVSDPTITEVHFCNRTDVCSLVVEVVDGVANVPNKLLQSGFDVRVFGYDGKATMHEATFKVKARTQPADYVYTETVVKSIEEILEAAETVTTTANEFYEFVEDHTLGLTDDGEGNVELTAVDAEGGNVDLTDYYTKTEVNELIENIDIPETDLTGYATETYVNEAIAAIEIPEGEDVDLSNYYTKDETYSKAEVDALIPEPDCAIGIVTNTSTAADIEAIRGRGDWPVFVNETNGMHLPLVDTTAGNRAYRFGAVYKNRYYIAELTTNSNTWTENVAYIADLTGYATETYVTQAIETALSGIAQAEGGAY